MNTVFATFFFGPKYFSSDKYNDYKNLKTCISNKINT